ncbi:MAG: hypothetical protein K2F95_07535 [Alistipes sp.]|nr:hypothetical protein [Alistipes sp.]MDE7128717.1 hypothetical protein [Alistipes sp.]
MKRKLWLTTMTLLLSLSAAAQNICLGERIPDIQVASTIGKPLDNISTDYVCLVFFHSESAPCVEAVNSLVGQISRYANAMSVVLLTRELREQKERTLSPYAKDNVTVAFDRYGRTFDNFGIRYVPFCVIYDGKRRKAQWIGSIQQLDQSRLKSIITQKPK